MQQTTKYKLNKPEADDPVAIAPLNENMDKSEAAIAAETAARQSETSARQSADTALSQRVTVLEMDKVKMVVGTYTGNGGTRIVHLDFTPRLIYVSNLGRSISWSANSITPCVSDHVEVLKCVDGGFQIQSTPNLSGTGFYYIALG